MSLIRAIERLTILKDLDSDEGQERFVALTNPKNISLMECVVAWTRTPVGFDGNAMVASDAEMGELWGLCNFNIGDLANTSGLNVREIFSKFKQMKSLGYIYPDGTASEDAITLAKVYMKSKIKRF